MSFNMLQFYTSITARAKPLFNKVLAKRIAKGKEDAQRLDERRGIVTRDRPKGTLIWVHAASVGEAQSALILIETLLKANQTARILVTTGTRTSAARMETALPERAFHQFIPLDHPEWVARFLDHWKPDTAFWMESELWPNMLAAMKERNIPAALINARLSEKSMGRWRFVKNSIAELLSTFQIILAQSEHDAQNFRSLGAGHVIATGNLKYSASPLPYNEDDFKAIKGITGQRPTIVYASTHGGEEDIAASIHDILANAFPDLLTIIIPRHPDRGTAIQDTLAAKHTGVLAREQAMNLPDENTRIYIANTLGEMGLFYRLSDIVYVGRSLSNDGGGGHNPLEPALLNCAVLHGANIQNLQDIYNDMQAENACIAAQNAEDLAQKLEWLLSDAEERGNFINRARDFSNTKTHVIEDVMKHISPMLDGVSNAA